ncbi:hypothetical protein MAELSTROM_27 [Pseudoalteromonas phage Maelstrom]|uniref:hypothetical protein n=1 Tax=Pseudoalteromonas phage Maelstrom TaxID=2065202 RepID=UPI000CA3771B|nr:hypothetical protein PP584_gp27 [Pseudoalteromonas phage Maelstrom]AUG84947.1 hypothetical protein MAELSTROM_27 [Pseudoalteromonas phage Maelstrom]
MGKIKLYRNAEARYCVVNSSGKSIGIKVKIKTKRGVRRIRNQRVISRRFVATNYNGCSYITAGKHYPFTLYGERKEGRPVFFHTICNRGVRLVAKTKNCPHLSGNNWQWGVI